MLLIFIQTTRQFCTSFLLFRAFSSRILSIIAIFYIPSLKITLSYFVQYIIYYTLDIYKYYTHILMNNTSF